MSHSPKRRVSMLLAAVFAVLWQGAPGTAAARPNHLLGQSSPYLLQHVDNPIDWYPWGEEALRKAKAEDRPIFLSIGYSACHWCHVMEKEVFSDEEIASILKDGFVS